MDTIKFANGEEHSCSFCSTIPGGTAFIALDDVTFAEAAALFSDEEKTSEIVYGNTKLVGYKLSPDGTGLYFQPYGIQAVLMGGHDEKEA